MKSMFLSVSKWTPSSLGTMATVVVLLRGIGGVSAVHHQQVWRAHVEAAKNPFFILNMEVFSLETASFELTEKPKDFSHLIKECVTKQQ